MNFFLNTILKPCHDGASSDLSMYNRKQFNVLFFSSILCFQGFCQILNPDSPFRDHTRDKCFIAYPESASSVGEVGEQKAYTQET
jgi:hypothetical protein